jgi:EmrB/QacA subfamily drug resistance transporter
MRKQIMRKEDNTAISPTVTLFVVSAVQFLTPLMGSAVGVALPTIGNEFNASAVQLSMIQMTYILAVAIFLLPSGRFADIHGRKRVFIGGIITVTLATLFLGWTNSILSFIVFRFVQGVGTAAITSTSFAILSSVFPKERRGRAMGIIVACVYVGLSAGPTLAGIVTSQLGWRWLFFLIVPIQLMALILTLLKLRGEWADARGESFDWIGTIIYSAALTVFITGVYQSERMDFAGLLIIAGIVGLVTFLLIEYRLNKPLLDVRLLLTNRTFTLSNIATLINYAASFGVIFLFTLYLQYVKGLSPQQAGFVLFIQPCVQAIVSPISGRLSDVYSPTWMATIGMAICSGGLIAATFIGAGSPLSTTIVSMTLLGIGFGVFSSPNMAAIMGSVEARHFGTASSMVATMRTLGMLCSMMVISLVLSLFLGEAPVSIHNQRKFVQSMHVSLIVFTVMSIVGILFSMSRSQTTDQKHRKPNASE